MKLDPQKIIFNRPLSLTEAVRAYTVLNEVIDKKELSDNYLYVMLDNDKGIIVEGIEKDEVEWMANELEVNNREAVVCIMEYPGFWEDLKDHLYNCRINDYKRFSVFTKADLMGEWDRTWEEYIGKNEEDAHLFFKEVLKIEGIVSILEMDDEEEEGY